MEGFYEDDAMEECELSWKTVSATGRKCLHRAGSTNMLRSVEDDQTIPNFTKEDAVKWFKD